MSRASLRRPTWLLGSCLLSAAVALPVAPALAATATPAVAPAARVAAAPPVPVAALSATVGDHAAVLRWTGGGTAGAVVRDVTGFDPATLAPARSGRLVAFRATGTAVDPGFANRAPATYAVWARNSDGATSATPALVTLAPARPVASVLTLTASPALVTGSSPLTLVGSVRRAGAPLRGAVVELVATPAGTATPIRLARVRTSALGAISFTWRPPATASYSLRFAGDAYTLALRTPPTVVQVQPRLAVRMSPATVSAGSTSHLLGTLAPARAGVRLQVQQQYGAAWRTVFVTATRADGRFDVPFRPAVGRLALRVVLPASAAGRSATSAVTTLVAVPRTLDLGSRGAAVTALEQRLTGLHYDVGRADGRFDADLQHAVIAFEKVERLPRNGTWGAAEQARAARPTAFPVRYPAAGRAVEVDITRQVLVLSTGGQVQRILDVSSGSERLYKQRGLPDLQVAHTPRGRYRVTHKIDGVRISPLGELYRPAYFFEGYAIHGNGSVPTTPQSHGCVRITDSAMDRLYALLTVGTPVAVYDE